MLFCGHMAALLPCRLCPKLGLRRTGRSQRLHGKASWSGELTPCLAVTPRAGGCVRARTPESHHLWGLAPGWGPSGQKGSWLVVGQQSSASHLQTRSPSSVLQQGTGRWKGTQAPLWAFFAPAAAPGPAGKRWALGMGPWWRWRWGGSWSLGSPPFTESSRLVWWLPQPPASFPKASLHSRRVLTHPLSILFLDFSP